VLCTLQRVYKQYVDVTAVVMAVARVIASLSVHADFHSDIFSAGKSFSLHSDVEIVCVFSRHLC